jgi:hypothetical protein
MTLASHVCADGNKRLLEKQFLVLVGGKAPCRNFYCLYVLTLGTQASLLTREICTDYTTLKSRTPFADEISIQHESE